MIDVTAELPSHFAESLATLGFEPLAGDNLPLDTPDPAKDPVVKARRAAAAAKTARKARKGERRTRGAATTIATEDEAPVIKLAIFDCDGTLVDSGHTIHSALNDTFARHGRPIPSQAQAKRVVGLSLHEAMAHLAPEAHRDEHAALADTYRDVFVGMRARGCVEEPLYDGIMGATRRAGGGRLAACGGDRQVGSWGCAIAWTVTGSTAASSRFRPPTAIRASRIRRWRLRR